MNKSLLLITAVIIVLAVTIVSAKFVEKNEIPASIKERVSKIRKEHKKSIEQKGMDDAMNGGMDDAMNGGMNDGMNGMGGVVNNDVGCGAGISRNSTTFCCPGQLPNAFLVDYLFYFFGGEGEGEGEGGKKSLNIDISAIVGPEVAAQIEALQGKPKPPKPQQPVPQQPNTSVGYNILSCDGKTVYGTIPLAKSYMNYFCVPESLSFKVYGVGNSSIWDAGLYAILLSYNSTTESPQSYLGVTLGFNTTDYSSPACLNCAAGSKVHNLYYSTAMNAADASIVFKYCNGTTFMTLSPNVQTSASTICLPNQFSVHSDNTGSGWSIGALDSSSGQSSSADAVNGGVSSSNCP